ncbi:HAD family hydrolase [Longibaculum muris]|uniref:HAD family hydrolase n=1 Tax=Longibaculum muris TaxID=1796628 RepID=UPI0018A0A698|nr:HAD family hydrolase [Longibaculum muris]
MKPMLCFDIDGTLRDNVHHEVCPSTLKALHMLKQAGYQMVISSGRGVDSLTKTGLMELIDWDGFVCNNGQIILDKNKKELFHAKMKESAVLETLKIAKELNFAVVLKSTTRVISKEPDEYVLESQRFFNNVIPPVGEYTGQSVDAMIVYGPKDYDYVPFLGIDGVNVLPGESTYADLTVAGFSKATGIHRLMEIYGNQEYIAFGDSMNDYEMFLHASLSVAMGQGNPRLKAIASYVTAPIDEDGIYKACLHLGLISESCG